MFILRSWRGILCPVGIKGGDNREGPSAGRHPGWLRERGEGRTQVRQVELFFDLVYALAVTQLTYHLLDRLSLRGAFETLLLLLAVWTTWVYTGWVTNYFDPDTRPMRLMLLGAAFASLVMSASIPAAFGDRGLLFAASLAAIQVGRTVFVLTAIGRGHHLSGNFQRAMAWWSATGLLWLAGGLMTGDLRTALWMVAVVAQYVGVWIGFPVPGLGRLRTTDYTIVGGHLAERCQLFVLLALGESILVTGADFGGLDLSASTVLAFAVAFAGSVALWWIYFDRGAEAGRRAISAASDPGRLGIYAYNYFHVPMVAGIIVAAAADGMTMAHPTGRTTLATTALILGGFALYLLGNALFEWTLRGRLPRSRLVAVCALAALLPLSVVSSALVLLSAATLVMFAVALRDVHVPDGA
jgi:low temperature requirement protein LtrA